MRYCLLCINSLFIISFFLTIPTYLIADPSPSPLPPVDLIYPVIKSQVFTPTDLPGSELTEQGRNIKGIYVPITMPVKWKVSRLVNWIVNKIGANAVIIDIKDDRGRVTFTRDLPHATSRAHGMAKRMPQLVQALKKEGIYVIGRLVCFKDGRFSHGQPQAAIRDRRDGKIWHDQSGGTWLDPFSQLTRDYITSIAKAAELIGFDEIQLDYVRFPVDPVSRYARFPGREKNLPRHEAIAALLAQVDQEIDLPLSIDVFGLTAYNKGDQDGLGQSLEHLAPYLDAISPMLYLANWAKPVWENPKPSRTHALIHNAVLHIRNRLGDRIAVRPLLQGFSYRALNFGTKFLFNQIHAAETAGSSGHLFWNQGGKYQKLAVVWRRLKGAPHILSPKPKQ